MNIFIRSFLCLLLVGCSTTIKAISGQPGAVSSSVSQTFLPSDWKLFRLDKLPLQIALPGTSVITESTRKFQGHDVNGVSIETASSVNDPAIWAHNPDYFRIRVDYISYVSSIEGFEKSICSQPLNGQPGYSISDDWSSEALHLLHIARSNCDIFHSSISQGVLIQDGTDFYFLTLPDGDMGSDYGRVIDIALRSIRPTQ